MPSLAIQEFLFIICLLIIPLFLINVFVFLLNKEIFKTTLIRSGIVAYKYAKSVFRSRIPSTCILNNKPIS